MAKPHPLCALLRSLRQAAGWSLGTVETRYGIPAVVLGSYERGDREPPLHKLESILSIYGYSLQAIPTENDYVRNNHDIVADLRAIADQLEQRELHDLSRMQEPAAA